MVIRYKYFNLFYEKYQVQTKNHPKDGFVLSFKFYNSYFFITFSTAAQVLFLSLGTRITTSSSGSPLK